MKSKEEFVVLVSCSRRLDNPWRGFDRFCVTSLLYSLWPVVLVVFQGSNASKFYHLWFDIAQHSSPILIQN